MPRRTSRSPSSTPSSRTLGSEDTYSDPAEWETDDGSWITDDDDEDEETEADSDSDYHPPSAGGRRTRPARSHTRSRTRSRTQSFEHGGAPVYTDEEQGFLDALEPDVRARVELAENRMKDLLPYDLGGEITTSAPPPMRFRILLSNMDDHVKRMVLTKLDRFQAMDPNTEEHHKIGAWLDNVCRLPLGIFRTLPVTINDGAGAVAKFLQNTRQCMDDAIYGHTETKQHLLRILAQWIANPSSCGYAIGIQGPPGIGKTSLVRHGIAANLGLPLAFVPLGGSNEVSHLEGHPFTYVGSTFGKIAESLIRARCMNPLIFFDELDKVSTTSKGDEIVASLIHLTDATQNDRIQDKYFAEVELDLSRALFVFSFNEESAVHPVLRDRMVTIRVRGYDRADKRVLARDYLWPNILKTHGFAPEDIVLPDEVIERIIDRVPDEEGVRNLKRGLETVASWINLLRFLPEDESVTCPFTVTEAFAERYVRLPPPDGGKSEAVRAMFT